MYILSFIKMIQRSYCKKVLSRLYQTYILNIIMYEIDHQKIISSLL